MYFESKECVIKDKKYDLNVLVVEKRSTNIYALEMFYVETSYYNPNQLSKKFDVRIELFL